MIGIECKVVHVGTHMILYVTFVYVAVAFVVVCPVYVVIVLKVNINCRNIFRKIKPSKFSKTETSETRQ